MRDQPLFTDTYTLDNFIPDQDSAHVFGTSVEERSAHSADWEARAINVNFLRVVNQEGTRIDVDIQGDVRQVPLRSLSQLVAMWNLVDQDLVYLDITGLEHHVWAPLLKAALASGKKIRVIYVEPGDYRFSPTPTEGAIFDLSESINGIAPIPGFVSLVEFNEDNVCFVPLLGFEGTRLAYILEQVQPPGGKIIPIVGVPGFRPEYPFHTFLGNHIPLIQNGAWRNVRFAIANCPFSLFYVLQDIAADFPHDLLKIAPIGTKPHALGAVLFSLSSSKPVELVYDHPIRKSARTMGAARLLVYHVWALQLPRAQF